MALLPLSPWRVTGEAGDMNHTATLWSDTVLRLARTVSAAVAECNYATRRMTELATTPDRYLPDSDRAPETYAEFLFRSSGVLVHEPTARARSRAAAHR